MHVLLKDKQLILIPLDAAETEALAMWRSARANHVWLTQDDQGTGLALIDLGPQPEICREPINVVSTAADPSVRLISNLATTPFVLNGQQYMSVESFWQGLKFADPAERERMAGCEGPRAKHEGSQQAYPATIDYREQQIVVGAWDHWQLMRRACEAKFSQHIPAREALLATGERPLVHRVRRDSRTIPGAIMAEIWMDIRQNLRR